MENNKADSNHNSADQVENSDNTVINSDNNYNIISNDEVRDVGGGGGGGADGGSRRRTPFTNLSQEEADLALARTLQEQERAYMMLRRNVVRDRSETSDSGSWETVSYGNGDLEENDFNDHDDEDEGSEGGEDNSSEGGEDNSSEGEDAFDANARDEENADDSQYVNVDPSAYSSDEAYARALQDAEEREMAARLLAMAGINEMVMVGDDNEDEDVDVDDSEEEEGIGGITQNAWEGIDPDELSYEELIALGEVVGTESRGLSVDTIASLPSVSYKANCAQGGSCDSCVICRLDYDEGEKLTLLSCKHSYHSECINNWLQINKTCPVCSAEVSTSGNS